MSHNRRRGQGFHAASLEHSIHDEHASTDRRARSMRRLAVGDLVAHPGPQHEGAAIPKVCEQFALQAVHDVAFGTPVIRDVAGRVLYDSDSNVATLKRSPGGRATLARVLRAGNISPVCHLERNIRQLHSPVDFRVAPVRPSERGHCLHVRSCSWSTR